MIKLIKNCNNMDVSRYTTSFLFIWSLTVLLTGGFNIDVEDAVKLTGLSDPGSYFGYSVGISHSDVNKWYV